MVQKLTGTIYKNKGDVLESNNSRRIKERKLVSYRARIYRKSEGATILIRSCINEKLDALDTRYRCTVQLNHHETVIGFVMRFKRQNYYR